MGAAADNRARTGGIEWTPANVVTVVRICFIPAFVLLMLIPWGSWFWSGELAVSVQRWTCMVVYALISLTDSLDGYLARSRNEITVFGKFIDPIADKLLVAAALIVLVETGPLPSWIPIVILAREFLVSGLRMVLASAGVVVAASWIGKAKTFVTLVAICLFIVKDTAVFGGAQPFMNVLAWALMISAVVLTLWSMLDYFVKSWGVFGGKGSGAVGAQQQSDAAPVSQASESVGGIVSVPDSSLEGAHPRACSVIERATEAHVRIGCAESCTGGLVASSLTSVPGSSSVIAGGVVSYMVSVKRDVLKVPGRVIEAQGVVSSATAAAMARGALRELSVDLAVSTTGVAGPGGGTAETPVGTVWFGVATKGGCTTTRRVFDGDRAHVRAQAVDFALELLEDALLARTERPQ